MVTIKMFKKILLDSFILAPENNITLKSITLLMITSLHFKQI